MSKSQSPSEEGIYMDAVAWNPEESRVRLIQRPEPSIERDSQVLVSMLEVGISQRELSLLRSGGVEADMSTEPIVMGNNGVGEVLEVGGAVEEFAPGDLVVSLPLRPCDERACEACEANQPNLCQLGGRGELGLRHLHGLMTERVVDEAEYFVAVPQGLRDWAVLIDPLSRAERALTQLWDTQSRQRWNCAGRMGKESAPRSRVLILGADVDGLLTGFILSLNGCQVRVCVVDTQPTREIWHAFERSGLELCVERPCVRPESEKEARPYEFIVQFQGSSDWTGEALNHLGANGLFLFALRPEPSANAPRDGQFIEAIIGRNQTLQSLSSPDRHDYEAAVYHLNQLKEHWSEAIASLVPQPRPFREAVDRLREWDGAGLEVFSIAGHDSRGARQPVRTSSTDPKESPSGSNRARREFEA